MKEFFSRLTEPGFLSSYFSEPFRAFTWRDALDIVCLAALFFGLYLFARNRRAGKLLGGVALIFFVYALGTALDLHGVRTLFGPFFAYGCIALIIIFQPELRALLERFGSGCSSGMRLFGVQPRRMQITAEELDEIVKATVEMHESHTGALIVLERSTPLGEYIRTGTIVNADLSSQLLRNIFYHDAPLHDGAVIVRAGRIHAAACFLPLSTKTDIHEDLATRHHAAIGLSEVSDGIAIVVSETTGIISVAYNGELFREFDADTLRAKLTELLGQKEQHKA